MYIVNKNEFISCLIDSGSSCSIIRKSLLNENAILIKELSAQIKGISDTFRIARKQFVFEFQVLSDCDFPANHKIIIGMNLLNKAGIEDFRGQN